MDYMNKTISVIIPALITDNRTLSMSIQCIERAQNLTDIKYETVIVETETDYLKDYADLFLYEKNKTNATQSINRGFKIATGDYIVLLTNDVFVRQGWLEALMEPFDKKKDCSISTLATSQLGHTFEDRIDEGIWFSVACFKRQIKYFDEIYINSWDDTDFVMRAYLGGGKMYRNYKVVVDHDPGQTQYGKEDHLINFNRNKEIFIDKYKDCGHPMYDRLIGGEII